MIFANTTVQVAVQVPTQSEHRTVRQSPSGCATSPWTTTRTRPWTPRTLQSFGGNAGGPRTTQPSWRWCPEAPRLLTLSTTVSSLRGRGSSTPTRPCSGTTRPKDSSSATWDIRGVSSRTLPHPCWRWGGWACSPATRARSGRDVPLSTSQISFKIFCSVEYWLFFIQLLGMFRFQAFSIANILYWCNL